MAEGDRSLAKIQEEKLKFEQHSRPSHMDISPSTQTTLMAVVEQQLQMTVAQLQVQNEELLSSPKRQVFQRSPTQSGVIEGQSRQLESTAL